MAASSKIIRLDAAPAHFAALRGQGRRIVQSHGVFDLMHPGHICHLEEARALGDVLVVTVTADKEVRKGPGRPYFNEQLRLQSVAALACVDHVILVPHPGAAEAIAAVRPHIYCKGKDHESPDFDPSGRLKEEIQAVQSTGGEVRFIGSISHSSTRLLNQYFDHLPAGVKEFCNGLAARHSRSVFHDALESFRDLKILVIGDTILDRYSYVKVQGLTSKNRIISGRFLNEETQSGGALAVVRHLKEFSRHVRYVSLVGTEPWVNSHLAAHLAPAEDRLIRAEGFTTIIKQRFVEPHAEGKEMSKLFAVNFIDKGPPGREVQERVQARIREEIAWADAVFVLDFGHGLMQEPIRRLVQETAPFLALNCQTNSNNHGFNIISRQYQRADALTLDEQELMLSSGRREMDHQAELEGLRRHLRAHYAWLTRGAVQTIGLLDTQPPCLCPPLENEVVDTVGAGDAFFSVAALAAARKLPVDLATFLGQLAGAQAVRIVGNSHPISRDTLLRRGLSLLNF
jgi:rfaE bifunctional protein nucleotidyltransferase chain/domain